MWPFPPPHTAERIVAELEKAIASFGVNINQCISITSDQGSNISKAIDCLRNWDWLPCILHIFSIVVSKALEPYQDIIELVSNAATRFRQSSTAWAAFKEIQMAEIQQRTKCRREQIEEEDEVAALVDRALRHNPAERFATADEFRVALMKFART